MSPLPKSVAGMLRCNDKEKEGGQGGGGDTAATASAPETTSAVSSSASVSPGHAAPSASTSTFSNVDEKAKNILAPPPEALSNPSRRHPLANLNPTTWGKKDIQRQDSGSNIGNKFEVKGPQPSCQLFGLFKALAAGAPASEPGRDMFDVDVDTDSDEEQGKDDKDKDDTATIKSTHTPMSDISTTESTSESQAPQTPDDKTLHGDAPTAEEMVAFADGRANDQESDAVKRWLKDTVEKNETIGSRFAALSVSAMSPFGMEQSAELTEPGRQGMDAESDGEDEFYPARSCPNESPEIATALMSDPVDMDMQAMTLEQLTSRFRRDHISPEEKLQVISEEFGDIASTMVDADGVSEPERLLAESQGSLFKGVMMIGNLHLTTHRLVFHALLPPDHLYDSANTAYPAQTEDEQAARDSRPNIIVAGPVTINRHSVLKSKRKRVWMELSPDMLTTYPSADEAGRVRPLYSILLSSALRLAPYNEDHPFDFYLSYYAQDQERTLHFTVDNGASAIRWRRHFESVLFRHARERFREAHSRDAAALGHDPTVRTDQWGLLRCCVPLDRAIIRGIGEYHSFATLVNLEVLLEDHVQVTWHPEEVAKGNYDGYGSVASRIDTPTRSRSLRSALPSFKRGRKSAGTGSQESSPKLSPLSVSTTAPELSLDSSSDTPKSPDSVRSHEGIKREDTRYMDSALNSLPIFNRLGHSKTFSGQNHSPRSSISIPPSPRADGSSTPTSMEEVQNTFEFLVAVLNEQAWFAAALKEAVAEGHKRHYKEGATPAKMVLDVGGYDCLATDDDLEKVSSDNDSSEHLDEDEEDRGKPLIVTETRKAEKAAMAARIFGLREDEGIWLKRCYVQHGLVPARGHIIVSPRYICFWRRANVGSDIKYRFSTRDVKGAEVCPPIRPGLHGFALKVTGHHDLRFEMYNKKGRDEVIKRVNDMVAVPVEGTATGASTPVAGSIQSAPAMPQPSREASLISTTTDGTMSSTATSATSPTGVTTAEDIWMQQTRDMSGHPRDLQINPVLVASGAEEPLKHAADVLAPPPDLLIYPKAMSEQALSFMPFVANRPWAVHSGWNVRLTPRRFTMLTIGSRGDVQPYIALALRLMQDGHKCVIVTHDEFKAWIEGYGIEHRQAGGDPTALMKLSTEHRMFSPGFFKEALGGFRLWLDQLLIDSWNACQDADVLIESPSAMAGVHIAEGLKIPYFRAFTMPWTRTAAYPQAFMVPAFEMGPSFNYSTYVLFDNIMWRATSGQINRWRKKYLNLGATDQSSLSISKVPFLYNFSPAVVPKPLDWYDDITITGYWNLENSDMDWSPPDSLIQWMDKAKADGKPIVYIGFGSIVVPDPAAMTKSIIKGVEKADVRAIVAKGWSARSSDGTNQKDDVTLPDSCYGLDKVPHGWLFPKIQAAMHHGGAGTVGASLRAGIPTLIKPWFGDQHFWAVRVSKLEVGVKVASLRSDDIADALRKATTNTVMIEKAARIGEKIRSERGVDAAVQAIHFNLVRAARDRSDLKKEDNANRKDTSQGTCSPHLGLPNISSLASLPTRPNLPAPSMPRIPGIPGMTTKEKK